MKGCAYGTVSQPFGLIPRYGHEDFERAAFKGTFSQDMSRVTPPTMGFPGSNT